MPGARLRDAIVALSLILAASTAAQDVASTMGPEQRSQAIRLGADDKAADTFLAAYVLQPRAGWGNGPLIGVFSTPFARVVRATAAARRRNVSLQADDIDADLLVPEMHVVALSQQGWPDETMAATVQSVTLALNDGTVIAALKTTELLPEDRAFYGVGPQPGVLARFPLSALSLGTAVHVKFDRTARGASGSATCLECVVPINARRIR